MIIFNRENVQIASLALKAYRGDIGAGVDLYKILQERNGAFKLITGKFPLTDDLIKQLKNVDVSSLPKK